MSAGGTNYNSRMFQGKNCIYRNGISSVFACKLKCVIGEAVGSRNVTFTETFDSLGQQLIIIVIINQSAHCSFKFSNTCLTLLQIKK